MLADVFLYGRTLTHDYFDMYLPSWLTSDSEEYREYRKTVSYIMKIRDILPENRLNALERTSDSFFFFRGRKVSLLARFCSICGRDEFDRPVYYTEGFAVRSSDLTEFWKCVPDMITMLSDSSVNFYRDYSEKYKNENKPDSVKRSEEILSEKYPQIKLGQFLELKDAVNRSSVPFSFAYGPEEKSMYDYPSDNSNIRISVFFSSDECTEIDFSEPEIREADFCGLVPFAEIKKSPKGNLRYRVILCSEPAADRKTDHVVYESYEREAGSEIRLSELFKMYETVRKFLADRGTDIKLKRKCVPYDSDSDSEYTGNEMILVFRQPAEQKRSLLQMIKGVRQPDFSEYIVVRTAENEHKLTEIFEMFTVSDDAEARLVSYEKLLEAAN